MMYHLIALVSSAITIFRDARSMQRSMNRKHRWMAE
jgi:hypothetical protein